MSGDRLDKGCVTWQGQRVFVPWFSAPRIVPTADDELRILKMRFRAHIVMAILFIPSVAIGVWLGDPQGLSGALVGVSAVFGIGGILERRHVRRWPVLMAVKHANFSFMLGYFRGLRIMERLNALTWVAFGAIVFLPSLLISAAVTVDSFPEPSFLIRLSVLLIGPGVLSFMALRYAAIAVASLLPSHWLRRATP